MPAVTDAAIVYRVTSGLSFIHEKITFATQTACPEFCAGMKRGFEMFYKLENVRNGSEGFININALIRLSVPDAIGIIRNDLMPLLTGLESNEMLLPADEEIKGAFYKLFA